MAGVEATARARAGASPRIFEVRLAGAVRGLVPYTVITVILLAWELFAHSGLVTPFMLPPIEAVAQMVWLDIATGSLFVNLGATLYRTFVGFGIAAVGGIAIGLLMANSRIVNWLLDPVVSAGFPMPKIAFLPVFILWFGLYDLSKIILIIVNAVFPVIIATTSGLRAVEREFVWSARSMGASERRVRWEIVLPAALPQILTGLQVALPISLIVAIVSEIIMAGDGLGGAMIASARYLQSPAVFAGIVEIAFTGFLVIKAMEIIRARALAWHTEATHTVVL